MASKPSHASGYEPEAVQRVYRTLLFIASKLGDLLEEIRVVGGLVPYLIVDQNGREGPGRHVGTMDLDLGLSLAILTEERYREISKRLRDAGFGPDANDSGNQTRQRWKVESEIGPVTADFLIPPNEQNKPMTDLEADFAALTTDGLDLAFTDYEVVTIRGEMLGGGHVSRDVKVCGAGAFVVLKALSYRGRGENKDAYDLFYVLRELGTVHVASRIAKFRKHPAVVKAMRILNEDFVRDDGGRVHVAQFLTGNRDADMEADVLGFVADLVARVPVAESNGVPAADEDSPATAFESRR